MLGRKEESSGRTVCIHVPNSSRVYEDRIKSKCHTSQGYKGPNQNVPVVFTAPHLELCAAGRLEGMLPQRNVKAIRICNLPIALPSLFSIIPSLPSPVPILLSRFSSRSPSVLFLSPFHPSSISILHGFFPHMSLQSFLSSQYRVSLLSAEGKVKARHGKAKQSTARHGLARQGKARQRTKQGRTRGGKA